MMKPRNALLAAAIGLVAGVGFSAALAGPPEMITIDACASTKSAVEFPHMAHAERLDCVTCHHTQKDLTLETADTAEACHSCHLEPEKADTPVCTEKSLKKNNFHVTCIGCHKEHKDDATAPPTKCKECHKKDEGE